MSCSHSKAVFFSFRSGDLAHALLLHDRLANWLGREEIFLDREPGNIRVTDDFLQVIKAAVEGTEILIALIGPAWASNENLSRLNDPEDVVRLELGRAFERAAAGENIAIIPVLVGGTRMPQAADSSPSPLQDLVKIQALTIPDESTAYQEGLSRLLDAIDCHSPGLRARRQNTW
ncbi:MAG TPA: toll/interleukin-1 receptor domain-containing protein, partial [Nitrospira sp.]|nr:toll/interleukin-1 receptor domain-containing protein [Nitrospira sp.]